MYKRILIANRGEIALRVIRACRELGISTVAIFSEADRGSAYLELADEAFCIGPAKASQSYLKIDRVISAAEVGNVEAIHPGYGFLAENAHFNEVCRSCKIDFIGPSPEAMELLGDKNRAREMARDAEVPVVPGSGRITDDSEAQRIAHEIGFPVLIKAAAGGGGKGMRVAANDLSLKSALEPGTHRSRGGLWKCRGLPREVHRAPAARRGPNPRRQSWQRRPPVGTRLFDPATTPEADRRKPRDQSVG